MKRDTSCQFATLQTDRKRAPLVQASQPAAPPCRPDQPSNSDNVLTVGTGPAARDLMIDSNQITAARASTTRSSAVAYLGRGRSTLCVVSLAAAPPESSWRRA